MSLQMIAGPSGCGKSHYVYKKIVDEAVNAPDKNFYVIVPEQFTMQAQKELVQMHPRHALLNIDILSFNRLAYRVFEETGERTEPILEDIGKTLVLQKIMLENKNSLSVLKNSAEKNGAASKLNSQLSEFIQYDVNCEELCMQEGKIPELLRYKLNDLSILSKKFSEYLKDRYLTAEEVPSILSGIIEKYEALKGAVVVLDGFTGFVPAQYKVIEKLLKICDRVIVTASSDRRAGLRKKSGESELFHMTHEMTKKLSDTAVKAGTQILPDIWIDAGQNSRFANNKALDFLEKNFFRYGNAKFKGEQGSVFIAKCERPMQEAQYASEIISRLIRTGKYRYQDFAFVTGNIEDYAQTVGSVFEKNEIPCYTDRKKEIISNPAVEFVRSAVAMAFDDFSYKSTFRYLKSGMTEFSKDEIYLLENYVLATGIRGYKKYLKEWERPVKTIDAGELETINVIRKKFVESIADFIADIKKKGSTVKEKTQALYQLIVKLEMQNKCKELEESFAQDDDLNRAGEYAQIYKIIVDFLDKLVEIMGDEVVSNDMYGHLIEAGFSELKIGTIPPDQDMVVIGDIERTRLKNVKIMFFAGLNDGIVPKEVESSGLLSENDRKYLSRLDVELAPDSRQEMYRQRLYLYLNLTKPSEKLFLTYSDTNSAGEALLPSYLVNVIREMFTDISIYNAADRSEYDRLETNIGRKEILQDGFGNIGEAKPKPVFMELVSSFRKKEESNLFVNKMIKASLYHMPDTNIGRAAARAIYGVNSGFSSSRLESFGKCAFSHFLKYALGLREREIFDFSPADIGSMLHEAVKLFCDEMDKIAWSKDSDIESIADMTFEKSYANNIYMKNSDTASFDRERLMKINRMTDRIICEQIWSGEFKTAVTEEKFMVEGIYGIIDRIDICECDDVTYLRVIDYKSRDKKPDLRELYYGIQLQLPLYLTAAHELMKKRTKKVTEAAGIYYYGMEDPLVKVESLFENVTEEKRLKELRLNGLSREEPFILQLMDKNLEPGESSKIIPVTFTKNIDKDGNIILHKNSKVLSLESFECLERYTRAILTRMREMIENGYAKIDPKIVGDIDSCQYCPYSSVCGFEEKVSGYKKKRFSKLTDEEVIELMWKDLNERKADGN